MADQKKMKVNAFRLEALRRNIPKEIPEERVDEYHRLIDELEAASDEDLSPFRIPADEVKPKRISIPIFLNGGPPPQPVFSETKYCDHNLFSRQIEGLWCCVQSIQANPSEPLHHPNDYWKMSDADLEQLAKKHGMMGAFGHQNWAKTRQAIISELVMRDQSLEPKPPTSNHTIHVAGNMTASVIQQGSSNAQATLQFNAAEIRETIEKIKELLPALSISDEAKEELETDIQTIEPQLLSMRPKAGIVKACLASIKTILQETTAHTGAILLAHQIAMHLEKMPH